jgi:hypothetical protein
LPFKVVFQKYKEHLGMITRGNRLANNGAAPTPSVKKSTFAGIGK